MNTRNLERPPLLRIVKRAERTGVQVLLLSLLGLVGAIIAGGLFLLALGHNPFSIYKTIVYSALRNGLAIQGTVKIAIPLLISALGITLAFKMKFWNIGAEGQIIMGGIFASYFALFYSHLPHLLLMALMLLAGMLGGGLWGLLPAFFKSRYGTNETLFTLMLNYIALYLIKYLSEGPWRDPASSGFPKIASFSQNARLDKVLGVHAGWIFGLLLVVFVFVYLRYTKHGYEIGVVGESQNTARYAGMHVGKVIMRTMFLSGAVCGIAGMTQVSGAAYTLGSSVAGGVGFTAIIVAWLGRLQPGAILVITALFAILEKGSSVMQSEFGLSSSVSAILQGILLFFVLAFEFLIQYGVVLRKKGAAT